MTVKTAAELKVLFQVKYDTEYAGFTGYPMSEEDSRIFFKSCLTSWLADLECILPPGSDPKPVPDLSTAPQVYVDELDFAIGGAIVFHIEMHAGYEEMIKAIGFLPGGDYTGGGSTPIVSITQLDPVPESEDFKTAILSLTTQYNTGEEFCQTLADAFDVAMIESGLTDCIYMLATVPTPGPIQFG